MVAQSRTRRPKPSDLPQNGASIFAVVGETTPTRRFIVRPSAVRSRPDLPIKEVGDEAPVLSPGPSSMPPKPAPIDSRDARGPPMPIAGRAGTAHRHAGTCAPGRWGVVGAIMTTSSSAITVAAGRGGDAPPCVALSMDGPRALALTTERDARAIARADPFRKAAKAGSVAESLAQT